MNEPASPEHILSWGAVCPQCRLTLPTLDKLSAAYFSGAQILCAQCKTPVDLWAATVSEMREHAASQFGIISLGAKQIFLSLDLAAGEHKEIDLTVYGIPDDATILNLNFTPRGGDCFPLVQHSNQALVRTLGTKFWVYGMPFVGETRQPGAIGVAVTWVHKDDDSHSWLYLLDAFEAMAARRWWNVILPAYAAFEIALMPVVREALEQHESKEQAGNFAQNEMKSSSALNVVLPILCEAAGISRMPDLLRGEINRLRKLRNDMVHKGVGKANVEEKTAARMLCSSAFDLEYLRFARPSLIPKP